MSKTKRYMHPRIYCNWDEIWQDGTRGRVRAVQASNKPEAIRLAGQPVDLLLARYYWSMMLGLGIYDLREGHHESENELAAKLDGMSFAAFRRLWKKAQEIRDAWRTAAHAGMRGDEWAKEYTKGKVRFD